MSKGGRGRRGGEGIKEEEEVSEGVVFVATNMFCRSETGPTCSKEKGLRKKKKREEEEKEKEEA